MKVENVLSPPSYTTAAAAANLPYHQATAEAPTTFSSPPPYPGSSCGGEAMTGLGREDTATPMDEDEGEERTFSTLFVTAEVIFGSHV